MDNICFPSRKKARRHRRSLAQREHRRIASACATSSKPPCTCRLPFVSRGAIREPAFGRVEDCRPPSAKEIKFKPLIKT